MSYHPNITTLRITAGLRETLFIIPVITLYVAGKGISFAQYLQIQSVFMVALIMSAPLASSWSDRIGYKRSILIGSALFTLGNLLIWLADGQGGVIAGEVLLAVAITLFNPAGEALLYTSLKERGQERQHHKVLNSQTSFVSLATALGMGTGGILYQWNPEAPILASVVTCASALVVAAVFLKETTHHQHKHRPAYRDLWRGTWEDLSHERTRWIVLLPGLVSGTTILLFWCIQPKLKAAGVTAEWMGWLLMGHFILRSGYAKVSPWVANQLGTYASFALSLGLLAAGTLSMGLLPWYVALPGFTLGSGLSYMLATSLGKDLLQHNVSGPHRATAMAGFNMVERLIGIATLNIAALLEPQLGLEAALLVVGATTLLFGVFTLSKLKTNRSP